MARSTVTLSTALEVAFGSELGSGDRWRCCWLLSNLVVNVDDAIH